MTGGGGFIGGHLAESFLADGHDVTVLDNLEPVYAEGIKRHILDAHREVAEGRAVEYRFVGGDVRDPETVRELVADVDVVVHQAAQAGVRERVDNLRKVTDINVDGTFLLVNGNNVFAGSVAPAVEAVGEADAALAVEEVSPAVATTTGVIETDEAGRVTGIVEKPVEPSSTLVTTGCYVLPPDVFHACALLRPSAEGEYQLSEAVGLLVRAGYEVATVRLGERVNVNTSEDIKRASETVREEIGTNRNGL